jgi:hypothetical protein
MLFAICVFVICGYLAYMELSGIPVIEASREGKVRGVEWRKAAKKG